MRKYVLRENVYVYSSILPQSLASSTTVLDVMFQLNSWLNMDVGEGHEYGLYGPVGVGGVTVTVNDME